MLRSRIPNEGCSSKGFPCKQWLLLSFDSTQYQGVGMMYEMLNLKDEMVLIRSFIKIHLDSTHPGTDTQR